MINTWNNDQALAVNVLQRRGHSQFQHLTSKLNGTQR